MGRPPNFRCRSKELPVTHSVSVAQLKRWVEGIAVSPDELLRKNRLKALLAF